jgi:hypothetical protein
MGEAGAELMVLIPPLFNGTLLDTIAKNCKREYGVKNPERRSPGIDIANVRW